MRPPHVSALMVALAVTACSSDDEAAAPGSEASTPATTEATDDFVAPEWEPSTRAEELAWEMSTSPDGATLQHAIDSFGLLDPDFPGVTPSELPPGDAIGDTSALALILSMRDELSAQQRARLDEYLAGDTLVGRVSPDGEIEVTGSPPATSEAAGWRPSGLPPVADYPALLAEMRQAWIDHLADAPGHIYELWITNQEPSGGMDAHASDENPDVCVIRVNPEFAFANPSDDKIRWWLAHELFHCMQFRWAAAAPFWNPHRWVTEGSADWAVADLFRNRQNDAGFLYEEWFVEAYRPLAGREYDAWPLYESAARNGNDVYGSIIRMMREPTAAVAPMLAVGHLDGLISRIDWATRALRDLAYGQDWWLDWPLKGRESSGPTKTSAVAGPLGLGTRTFGGQGRFSQQVWTIEWTSDVDLVTVFPTGSPLMTFTAAGTKVVPDGSWGRFCFDPAGCVCPNAGAEESWPMIDRSMPVTWAASEVRPRALVLAEQWDPEERCDERGPDQGSSDGDPHLLSFDGLPFDVTALGEFVLARDPAGDFEVQTRHVSIGFGTGTTAVAVGDGTSRVTFTMPGFFTDEPTTVRADGEVVAAATFMAGDLRVSTDADRSTVVWPDGSTVALEWYVGWFVTVTVPAERSARMEGLLGAADGDLRNDLRLPDGTFVDTDVAADPESRYALAWAVDDATTLFDYEPGASVDTFRLPHPQPSPMILAAEAVDACTSALGADAAAHEVSSCAFDVSATGDGGFVEQYVDVVEDRDDRATLAEPLPERPTTAPPGSVAPAVAGRSGEPAFTLTVDRPAATVDSVAGTVVLARATAACGDVHLRIEVTEVGGDGFAVATLCDAQDLGGIGLDADDEWINGEAYLWLPSTGTYNVGLAGSIADAEALGAVDVYVDASPVVVDASNLVDGDRSTLSALADVVVYLPDPAVTYRVAGADDAACAVEVWSGRPFPDSEPRNLGACEHADEIDFPPTDMTIPVVVFNRSGEETVIEVTPS